MCEYLLLKKISKRIKIEDNQLTVKKNTFLACTRVRSLPEGIHFKENLNLQFCYKLTIIKTCVGECLDLKGCFSLYSIFKHLFVGLDLNLTHCHHLSYLSENIFVGRNLNLEYCTEIKQLPENMFVGGILNLEMCKNIRDLPQWVLYCFNLINVPDHLKTTDNFKTFKILKHFDTNSAIDTINCDELIEIYLGNQQMYNQLINDRQCFRIAYKLFRNIGLSNTQKTFKENANADSKNKIRNHLIYFVQNIYHKNLIIRHTISQNLFTFLKV